MISYDKDNGEVVNIQNEDLKMELSLSITKWEDE